MNQPWQMADGRRQWPVTHPLPQGDHTLQSVMALPDAVLILDLGCTTWEDP